LPLPLPFPATGFFCDITALVDEGFVFLPATFFPLLLHKASRSARHSGG